MYNESNIDSYENVRFPLIEQNSNSLKYAFPVGTCSNKFVSR